MIFKIILKFNLNAFFSNEHNLSKLLFNAKPRIDRMHKSGNRMQLIQVKQVGILILDSKKSSLDKKIFHVWTSSKFNTYYRRTQLKTSSYSSELVTVNEQLDLYTFPLLTGYQ